MQMKRAINGLFIAALMISGLVILRNALGDYITGQGLWVGWMAVGGTMVLAGMCWLYGAIVSSDRER